MTLNDRINQLIDYGLKHHLFDRDDLEYVISKLKSYLNINNFRRVDVEEAPIDVVLLALTENDDYSMLEVMDWLLPRPSELYKLYRSYYKKSPNQATKFFYDFSNAALNIHPNWKSYYEMEKCKFKDYAFKQFVRNNHQYTIQNPKVNLRVMPISFNNEKKVWRLSYQFKPFFNEQAIIYREEPKKIKSTDDLYNEMLNFLNKFPHYFITPTNKMTFQNTSHQYMVGREEFPIEDAQVITTFKSKRVKIELLRWYLPVVKLINNTENRILDVIAYLERAWMHQHHDQNILFPFMRLDGIQFNVYLFFLKRDDLGFLDGATAMGYINTSKSQNHPDVNDYVQSLIEKNVFYDQDEKFISFVEKAV